MELKKKRLCKLAFTLSSYCTWLKSFRTYRLWNYRLWFYKWFTIKYIFLLINIIYTASHPVQSLTFLSFEQNTQTLRSPHCSIFVMCHLLHAPPWHHPSPKPDQGFPMTLCVTQAICWCVNTLDHVQTWFSRHYLEFIWENNLGHLLQTDIVFTF